MKKSCAVKCIAIVLAMVMVLGTSISAMAANVSSTTKYVSGGYRVTTDVSDLSGNEMVTYLVHDADSLYKVAPANIEYVDQKTATAGGSVQFGYTGEGTWDDAKKIYVGAESLSTPVQSTNSVLEAGATLMENGKVSTAVNESLTNVEGNLKTINLSAPSVPVVSVYKNEEPVDFFKTAEGIAVTCAITEDDIIYVTYQIPEIISAAAIINNGNANIEYSAKNQGGTIATLNRTASYLLDKTEQGEPAAADYWFLPNKWTVENPGAAMFAYNAANKDAILASNVVEENVKAAIAASDDNPVVVEFTDYQPAGITLNGRANTVSQSIDVPVDGVYDVVVRANAYETSRHPIVKITDGNGELVKEVEITPSAANSFALSKGDSVELKAGTYNIELASTNLVRFDFAVLLPQGAASNAALAGKEAFLDFVDKATAKTTTEIRLGSVKLSDTALTAFARVIGNYETCGIKVGSEAYRALGVLGDNGAFAVELADENGGLIAEFENAEVCAYADAAVTAPGVITVVE